MNRRYSKFAMSLVLGIASVGAASADSVKRAGTVCWMGEITESVSTTKEDRAWTYKVGYVFTSDGADKQGVTGECVGMGALVAGKPELLPNFCSHFLADGATYMSRSESDEKDNQTRTYYGGTGSMKSITGRGFGKPPTALKAPKGKFAGCRSFEGEFSVGG